MQVFSTFEGHGYLELAISTLQKKGITTECIFAVPLDNRKEDPRIFDTLHRSDGTSLIDIGMGLGTAFSVVGASIGFKLAWGPIIWGILSAIFGFILGFLIRLFYELVVKKKKRKSKGDYAEVILIIECDESQAEFIENILWNHFALGVAKVK